MRKFYLSIFTFLILAGPVLAQKKAPFTTVYGDPIGVKKQVLDNGMQIFLIEDHNQPRIFGAVAVKAGGKYDPKDATGMGHYLEHMLFKGTQTMGTVDYAKEKPYLDKIDVLYEKLGQTRDEEARKKIQKEINDNAVAAAEFAVPNEFDRMLAGIGGQSVNAFTSEEMIVYHNYFPPNQVEKWLDIYSERFINPVFRLFQSELETVYEEKNRAMDNFIFALLHNFNKNLYKNHPYGQQDLIGSTEHLKNPSLTKMYEYFEQYYVSNNMALILSGDFDAAKVMPLIKAKFGRLKRGTVPPFPEYKEAPFAGRELVVGRYTPVAAALIGFRTVPVGHRDGPALDVVNYFLSNNGGTGLLDRLSLDQKILVSQLNTMRYADHGASMLVVVPKIIGQSIKKAEKLVLEEIEKLHRGEITQAQLTAAKLNLKQEFELEMEGLKSKALRVTNSFISGEPWENVVAYPSQIEKVSLERIAEVSKKYYGKNYLILQSKMGFPKKDKLSKPPYSPPIPKTTTKSAYAKHFDQLPSGTSQPHFVDFNTDVQQIQLADHAHLFRVENPSNNVFRLKFRYSIGKNSDPTLAYVAEYMGYLGTESQSTSEIRSAFDAIGCTYDFSVSKNYFTIELEGGNSNLASGLKLLRNLILQVKPDKKKAKLLSASAKTDRKLNNRDMIDVGNATFNYALYGKNSQRNRQLSVKKIKALKPDELVAKFQEVLQYAVEVHYTGDRPAERVADLLNRFYFEGKYPTKAAQYVSFSKKSYTEPTVFFLNRKDAIQSQIYFYKESEAYQRDRIWLLDAFNEYFGSGMSSLVFQEIREFRSLAYTARARIYTPDLPNQNNALIGYIGCQADKTKEALAVMTGLLRDMPAKPERIDGIRAAVTQTAYSSRPGFRDLSTTMVGWKHMGYTEDPAKARAAQFEKLNWQAMQHYYESAIGKGDAGKPLVIVITGDKNRIDMDDLKKYGKLIEVKQSEVMVK